jgi:hypothetical protein
MKNRQPSILRTSQLIVELGYKIYWSSHPLKGN